MNKTQKEKNLICGAKTRAGTPCRRPPRSNGRCKLHGGKSLKGIGSPTFKTGKYSKYLPAPIQEKYHEAIADKNLLTLRSEIGLVDTRIFELCDRLNTGETDKLWNKLSEHQSELKQARETGDTELLKSSLESIIDMIEKGDQIRQSWKELLTTIDVRRKLVESEWDRLAKMDQLITAEQAIFLMSRIVGIIKDHVTDKRILSDISEDLAGLLNRNGNSRASTIVDIK